MSSREIAKRANWPKVGKQEQPAGIIERMRSARIFERMQSIEGFLISLAKIMLAAFLLICLFSLVSWIWLDDGGIIILPFETGDEGDNGQALADLLTHDLLRIKLIHEAEMDLPQPLPIGNYSVPEITPQGSSIGYSIPNGGMLHQGISIGYSIPNVGILGQGQVFLSLGNILLTLKQLAPFSKPSPTLSCSLQRYGSRVVAVALFDDGRGIEAWEAIYEGNLSEGTPELVQDLAYKVYHGLCLRKSRLNARQTEVKLARDWRAFGSITQAMEARQLYLSTGDLGQLNHSRDKAREANALEPGYIGSAEVLFGLGFEYLQNGLHDQALATYDDAISIKADDPRFWNGKGLALLYLGRKEDALGAFDKALQIDKKYAIIWANMENALLSQGRNNDALDISKRLLKIKQDEAIIWANKGNAFLGLNRMSDALDAYNQSLELNQTYVKAIYGKGGAYLALGQFEEALVAFNKTLQLKQDYVEAAYGKGIAYLALGRYEEAIAAFNEILQLVTYIALIQNDDISSAFDEAVQLMQDNANAIFGKGLAYFALGQYDQALVAFNEVLQWKQDDFKTIYWKGQAYLALGQNNEALTAFDKALQLKQDYVEAIGGKGQAYLALGQYDEALTAFDEAIRFKSDFAEAWSEKGIALQNLGRNNDALAAYQRALDLSPQDPIILGNYAGLLLAIGNTSGFAPLEVALHLTENETTSRPLRLECFFYLYAHSPDPGQRDEALSEIKALMKEGVRSPGWDLSANVKAARNHPDPALLEALARVISGEGELSELDAIPAWRDAGA